jgi:hypothetical protein
MLACQKNARNFLTSGTITTKAKTMKPGDICYLGGGGKPLTIRRIVKRPSGGWQVTVSYSIAGKDEDAGEVYQLRSFDANQLFTALPGDPERMPVWQMLYAQVRK